MNFVLKWFYSKNRLIEKVSIHGLPPGPHVTWEPNQRMAISGIRFSVNNLHPFPIEMESIQFEATIGGCNLGKFQDCEKRLIEAGSTGISLSFDLNENQVNMIRKYGDDFRISGNADFRTKFASFKRNVGAEMSCRLIPRPPEQV